MTIRDEIREKIDEVSEPKLSEKDHKDERFFKTTHRHWFYENVRNLERGRITIFYLGG